MNSTEQVINGIACIGLVFKPHGVGSVNGIIFRVLYKQYIAEISG